MALIQCPECDGKVSDQAPVCPHCGFPLGGQPVATQATGASIASETHMGAGEGISHDALPGYPGKPFHWTDRVPVAFLLFWGGMLVGVMGGGTDMVESLSGGGVGVSERTTIGWLAWGMVIGGIVWFLGKNLLSYLHYRNWKIDRLHREMIDEAEREEQAAGNSSPAQP